MQSTLTKAKSRLEAFGLHVSVNFDRSLWIAATFGEEGDNGVRYSQDACVLCRENDACLAIFPAEGIQMHDVPGTEDELTELILAVYANYRAVGGPFKDAFQRVASDPKTYLSGRDNSINVSEEFVNVLDYVLEKNAELYRRLA